MMNKTYAYVQHEENAIKIIEKIKFLYAIYY